MRNTYRKSKTTDYSLIFVLSIWFVLAVCWVGNLFKLLDCDFEPNYKGEIIHAIGLIPIASVVTVWYDDK